MAKRKIKVDMSNVSSAVLVPEGRYSVKVTKADQITNQAANEAINVRFVVLSGPEKGSPLMNNFVLTDTSLWKLQEFLRAIGQPCDGANCVLNLDAWLDKKLNVDVEDHEYNGNVRSQIRNYMKFGNVDAVDQTDDEDDDEDEEEVAPVKSKKPAKKAPIVEDDDDEEDEDEDDEEEVPTPKKSKKPEKKPAKLVKKAAKKPVEDDDDDEDWDDDWDDED